ncbi:MAG: hypothetical protein ABI553_08625 [Chloroflexota bacterium]
MFAFRFTSGPITGTRVAYVMAPIDDERTRLTRTFSLRLRGWWILTYPLSWRERAAEVDNVKRILERTGTEAISVGVTTRDRASVSSPRSPARRMGQHPCS